MALEQHNTAFEFEAMLRSHLSRGGSMVEACGGFDADKASAYLEDALGQMMRSQYDAHLAGCPSCRRSVIELSRLIYSSQPAGAAAEQAESQATPSREGARWKTVVAGWLGLSEWNLATRNWGLATAGAAGALLLAILATQLWRQPGQGQLVAGVVPAATDNNQPTANSMASPTPGETTAPNSSEIAREESQSPSKSNVPSPIHVGPADLLAALSDKPGSTDGVSSESARLAPVGNTIVSLPPTPPAPSPNVMPVVGNSFSIGSAPNFTPLVESKQLVALPEAPPEATNAKILAPLNPSPNDNPMRGQKPQPTSNVFNRAFAFVPSRKDGAERKPEMSEIEEGAPKVLAIRVHDKVFNFRSGTWIDQAYKPDMAWRITKLVQDSDEYKRVLADEPQLKDFFERGAVIVVWKDKIYKVVAK